MRAPINLTEQEDGLLYEVPLLTHLQSLREARWSTTHTVSHFLEYAAGRLVRIAPFPAGSACCPSGKAADLDGQTRRKGQSASRGISGLCGGPAWRVHGGTAGRRDPESVVDASLWAIVILSGDVPCAGAQVCRPALPPPCLSVSADEKRSAGLEGVSDLWWKADKLRTLTDILSSLSRSMSTAFCANVRDRVGNLKWIKAVSNDF